MFKISHWNSKLLLRKQQIILGYYFFCSTWYYCYCIMYYSFEGSDNYQQ